MSKMGGILAVIISLMILAQWFVFVSLRSFLLQIDRPITRTVAYPVIAAFSIGCFTIMMALFRSSVVTPGSLVQKIGAVTFFTYLGCVLLLAGVFLFLRLGWIVLMVKDKVAGFLWSSGAPTKDLPEPHLTGLQVAHSSNMGSTDIHDSADAQPDGSSSIQPMTMNSTYNPSSSRRVFLKWGAATGLVSALGLAGHGIAQAYGQPVVEEHEFTHTVSAGTDCNLTVIHITDFHFGPFFMCPELERLVSQVNNIEGDMVCVTGDIFHSSSSPAELVPGILQRLRTRKLGNYAVLGNHDYYAGEFRSVKNIERSNLRLLRDEWITFEHGNSVVHMGGLDDPRVNWMWGEKVPNFPKFMARAPKGNGLRIALSHRPSVLPLAARSGIDLVLSGHTHGGQIVIPRLGQKRGASIAGLVSPYTLGWYRVGQCSMYLNRGVGMTFLPWRINCPPEIAVIRIKCTGDKKPA